MFTTGSKWFFGLAGAAVVAALVYGGATSHGEVGMDTILGVLTLGYKGGVGDHIGYSILMGLAGACIFLGATTAAFRDSEVAAVGQLVDGPVAEPVAPVRGSYWPVVGAFGAAMVAVGLATSSAFVAVGAVVIVAVAFEWAISAWSDKLTVDRGVGQAARRRVMLPLEVPILGSLGVALFVLAASRILLAISKEATYFIFGGVALIVLILGFVLASKPKMNSTLIASLCVVGGIAILAGGVVSAVVGPRDIEPHHDDHGTEVENEGAPALDDPVVLEGAPS